MKAYLVKVSRQLITTRDLFEARGYAFMQRLPELPFPVFPFHFLPLKPMSSLEPTVGPLCKGVMSLNFFVYDKRHNAMPNTRESLPYYYYYYVCMCVCVCFFFPIWSIYFVSCIDIVPWTYLRLSHVAIAGSNNVSKVYIWNNHSSFY